MSHDTNGEFPKRPVRARFRPIDAMPSFQPCGLSYGELQQACKNIGFDLTCGACASLFFTGYDSPSVDDSPVPYEHTCPRCSGPDDMEMGRRYRVILDEEAARWQKRITEVIDAAGLDHNGVSGKGVDPLDWTADQVAAALREALDEDDDGEPGVLNLIVPADPDAGRCTAPETPATPAEPGMRKLEPKRKYDCANCGCGSANDQVMIVADTTAKYVITDVEFCPDCASAYMKGRDEATDTRPHLVPKHTGDCNVWCNDGRCYETKTMTAPQLADELAKVREQIAKAKVILRGTSSQVTQVVRDTLEALEVTT